MKWLRRMVVSLIGVAVLCMAVTALTGRGSTARARIKPGMPVSEVLAGAKGWLVSRAVPGERPGPDAIVQLKADSLEVHGFGKEDGVFHYRNEEEMAAALNKLMGGKEWTLTFGYIAEPRRQYFDVVIDKTGKVSSVSAIRSGKLD